MAKTKTARNGIEVTPEARNLMRQSKTIAAQYEAITITSNNQYVRVAEDIKGVKGKLKRLLDLRLSITRPLDQSKARVMDLFRPPMEIFQRAERVGKAALGIWDRKQEDARRTRERKLAEQARAEEDRKKKKLEARAEKAETKGNVEKAEDLRQEAEETHVPAPIIERAVPKVNGIHTTKTWKYRIKDINKVPREFMVENFTKLGQFARATQGKIPLAGVEFYEQTGIASGVK